MEEIIPTYNIDFRKDGQDHFFLHLKEKNDPSRQTSGAPHKHNYYSLSFLYEGKMPHFADFEKKEIEGPALLTLNIDQVHIHPDAKDCKVLSMAFSSDFLHGQNKKLGGYIESVFDKPHLKLTDNELNEIDRFIHLICLENDKEGIKDFEIIKCLLNAILIRCAKVAEGSSSNLHNKNDLFTNFKNILKNNYKNHHQVKFYADKLNITTDVLNQVVKNASFKTPKQLIDERLLVEAKRLLYWSDITVREVAWELGFATDAYFNRFFKKFIGSTPKEFQQTTR